MDPVFTRLHYGKSREETGGGGSTGSLNIRDDDDGDGVVYAATAWYTLPFISTHSVEHATIGENRQKCFNTTSRAK